MTTNSELYAILRNDLVTFVEKVFQTLNPGEAYHHNWHVEAIVWQLVCIMNGETNRAMIHVPPRTLKSIIVSVAWPAFLLGHDPTRKLFVISHNLDLAEVHHAAFRTIVESDWYKATFPTMTPEAAKDTNQVLRTSKGGFRKAFSAGSHITGQGADIIIFDDPLDASDAQNEVACQKLNEWIATVPMGRFNNGPEGIAVLVMQRLAMSDPATYLRQIEPWDILCLPAWAQVDQKVPIGPGRNHLFRKGQMLFPMLLSADYLNTRKVAMGSAAFSAQYLQEPVPAGGGHIDISMFQRYRDLPKAYDTRFLSIDAASGSDSGSYSVIQVWQITNGCLYLVDSRRARWSFPDLRKMAISMFEEYNADFYLIELAFTGHALAEQLWEDYPRETRSKIVQRFPAVKDKVIRMESALVAIEARRVYLPETADFLPDLTAELQAFPYGQNDDQVDALSQAVWFLTHRFQRSCHNPKYRGRVIASW
jgi:predicted phage terminase large subunit-like protein